MAQIHEDWFGPPASLEEFDFPVHHRPGKAQTHVDGLSRLPVEQAPPEGEKSLS